MSTGPTPSPAPATGAAVDIDVTPAGNLASTDVQAALQELQGDIDAINAIATTADVTYYVNASTGNDSNSGLSAGSPLLTLQAAADKLKNKDIYHSAVINLAAGTYAGAVFNNIRAHQSPNPTTNYSQVAILGAYQNYTPVGGGTGSGTLSGFTASSGQTLMTMTDSGQAWATDSLKGRFVRITGGTGSTGLVSAPPRYVIVSNTATTMTVLGTGTLAAINSTYQIETNSVFINAPTPTSATGSGGYSGFSLSSAGLVFSDCSGHYFAIQGIEFTIGTSMPLAIGLGESRLRMTGNRFIGGAGSSSCFNANNYNDGKAISILHNYFSFPSATGSIIAQSTTGGGNARSGFTLTSNMFEGGAIAFASSAFGGSLISNCVFKGQTSAAINLSGTALNQVLSSRFDGCTNAILMTSSTATGLPPSACGITQCDFSNCTTAINLNSAMFSVAVSSTTGSTNTTLFALSSGAKASIASSVATAATNEINLDGTIYTLAAMRAASPKMVATLAGTMAYETTASGPTVVGTTVATAGKVLTTAGLGVGNSAAASTPGTVTRKIEVFDASGASLGFIAVYNAIT